MSAEAEVWLQDARENLQVAEWCLSSGLFNHCLQNAQQTVEKVFKALLMSGAELWQGLIFTKEPGRRGDSWRSVAELFRGVLV